MYSTALKPHPPSRPHIGGRFPCARDRRNRSVSRLGSSPGHDLAAWRHRFDRSIPAPFPVPTSPRFPPHRHATPTPAQPVHLVRMQCLAPFILVCPVRAEADFCLPVHFPGTNLDLQHSALRPHDRGMDRPVAVVLGICNVVVELAPDMRPRGMDHAQRSIAALDNRRRSRAPLRRYTPGKGRCPATHLAPDAVDMLRAADHLRANAGIGETASKLRPRWPAPAARVRGDGRREP